MIDSKICDRSVVAQWLVHWPLVLGVPGSIPGCSEVPGSLPASSEETWVSKQASLHVFYKDDMNTVHRPSDRDVNWRPPVHGQSSFVQVKDTYTGSILMHVGSSCKQTRVYNVNLPRIIRN